MNIDGLGGKTASQLVERGMLKTLANLNDLTAKDLSTREGFATKSAKAHFDAIHGRAKVPLDRFIRALGIHHVGSDTALWLARAFGSLDVLRNAFEDDISAEDNIGPKTTAATSGFFAERHNSDVINRLLAAGVAPQPVAETDSSLSSKTFALTGTLLG